MAEQLIDVADASTTYNTRKSSNQDRSNFPKECEVSKTSFFRFDKNYRPREYDKTNKVLPPSQTDSRTSKGSEIQFLCEVCSKKYKLHSRLKRHQKNWAKPTHEVDINPSETTSINISQQHLTSRFEWGNYKEPELLIECETIQKSLSGSKRTTTIAELSKQLKNYMKKGNVNAALKLLTNNMKDGILPLNIQTLNSLKEKHPKSKDASIDILLTYISRREHPIKFEGIDEEMVRKATIKTKGGSGPSAMDADRWRRILCSNNFGDTNVDLRKAIANFIKKICTEEISATSIETFVACRLIPLDKNPGLGPIGVGEILRRITGKITVSVVKKKVISSTGSLQVCAGQEAGSEAAIHAMEKIFKEESTEAVLLVDAPNAFNSINRKVHNISILCPAISTFATNCYTTPARLFVIGGIEMHSNEGTTQGDPVVMAIYAIGITPLIMMMIELVTTRCDDIKMVAFADDFADDFAAGKLTSLLQWWTTLLEIGSKFGYYPEPKKSWLITKLETHTLAKEVFKTTKVKITNSGKRYLGQFWELSHSKESMSMN